MKKLLILTLLFPLLCFGTESTEPVAASASPAENATVSAENTKTSGADSNSVPEADIPVKLEADKKATTQDRSWPQVLGGLVVCCALIFGSIVLIRRYSLKNQKNPMHQIKVVTQYHLGPRKSLAVIRIAGESVLVGVTDHHISLIKSLSLLDGELPESDEVPQNFKTTLNQQEAEGEEFSIQGLQDVVKNKLKSMRNI